MKIQSKLRKSKIRYALLIVFLVAVNVTLGMLLVSQSSMSMKELIDLRMLDIVNTAADMIDGDVLKTVTPEDKGTDGYEAIMKTLTYFQDNIELKYIYCIQDMGNKNFAFGLDPTVADPGEFGLPVRYTDALYKASQGKPAVDESPYEDSWGTFYSAYSPVFDSSGNVAGIVAVDFSKDWFETQLIKEKSIIFGVVIVTLLISFLLAANLLYGEKKRREIAAQLSVTADIYISMHEINFLTDTFSEVINNKKEASTIIGETRTNSQAIIRQIMTEFSDLSSREAILDFVDFSKIDERLRDRNTITLEWLNADGEWRRSRYIVSERTPAGYVARALYLIEDIDSEKIERDTALETIDKMNEQISSVASIYFRMADLNFENDTVQMIRTQMQEGQGTFIDGIIDGAYAYIKNVMENFVEDSSRQTMLDFIDYNTLNDRLKNTNTITEEFISKKIGWCRARYIVSKRKEDGTVAHALWLVEIIDEEKRRRDMLTRAAETLNDRASSIANIYMTVHEVDLITDTFTEIRSKLDYVNDVIGESKSNAQVTLNRVMDNVVHESCIEDIHKFVNFRTLEKRLRKTDTITMEYMNKEKLWRRGRFIVSKRDENGKLTRVIWLTEDIHDEKIERDKLIDMSQRALAASEAKSAFLSNMSHEIRTPINAVLGMNEMILRECEDENIVSYSNTIRTAGATLLGLVNDILDFSKIEAGKMEIIPVDYDLSSVISDLVNMIQQKADDKGLRLILEINKDVPKQLHGDEVRIKQVITNILTNAVKYTEKGSVTFSIDYETIPDEPDMVSLNIAVKDTGIGIKKKDMYRLFSEFDRIDEERNRKVEGTGLGMSITKRLLEMMGSILEVESIYKLGSKFSFKLKQQVVKWDKLGNYEAAYKAALGNREKYHEKFRAPDAEILIIDDTPENIIVFKSLLKQTCVQIETAESGDEGIALSYNKKFDIIFIDHMMPNKDGIETLYEMREDENNPNIDTPMVCLTANAISGARERYISEGFDDYLTKPIEPERLEQMLLEYLSKDKILSVDDETDVKAESGNLSDTTGSKWYDNLHEIDVDAALKNSGSEDMFYMVLQLYNEAFEERYEELNRLFETKDLEEYTIKVHALKSSSRLVGALELGDKAEALEHAGNDNDIEYITNNHEDMMESYRLLINEISPLFPEE